LAAARGATKLQSPGSHKYQLQLRLGIGSVELIDGMASATT
jgi:hypothetical protein